MAAKWSHSVTYSHPLPSSQLSPQSPFQASTATVLLPKSSLHACHRISLRLRQLTLSPRCIRLHRHQFSLCPQVPLLLALVSSRCDAFDGTGIRLASNSQPKRRMPPGQKARIATPSTSLFIASDVVPF